MNVRDRAGSMSSSWVAKRPRGRCPRRRGRRSVATVRPPNPTASRRTLPMARGPNRPRSWEVTDGPERAPARAYLRAVGFSEDDFDKPQVGVASSWNEVTPCNYHLDKLAALAK